MKDINAKAMQDLTFNSIVKIKKNKELELERMKPIMEKYVKRHIIPKIKKAAEKGEYYIHIELGKKPTKYRSLVIDFLGDNGYHVDRSFFTPDYLGIHWD